MARLGSGWLALLLACVLGVLTAAPTTAAGPFTGQARGRYFAETGYRVDDDAVWAFFQARGGVDGFGYPVSRPFRLLGCRVQIFQRQVVQLCPGQGLTLLNLLDPEFFPYSRINGSAFPAPDPALKAATPRPEEPAYATRIVAFVRATAPDSFAGQPVKFGHSFFGLLTPAPTVAGSDDPTLQGLVSLEFWGVPTSRPRADPSNANFIYQRFQRGIMHYDATTGLTRGVLLADYFKGLLTGQDLPADLEQEAQGSRFLRQFCPQAPRALCRPEQLPDSDLSHAFEPEQPFAVDTTFTGPQYGFQADLQAPAARRGAITLTRAARFGWLKQQVVWSRIEVAPGVYDPTRLAELDALVEEVHGAGLRLLLSIAGTPRFYAPGTGGAPQDPAPLGAFLRMLALRYRGQVQAYEPWNEPNLAREWGSGRLWPDGPRAFVHLQQAAYAGLRAGDPGALVVLPPLAPSGVGGCTGCDRSQALDDRLYLELVYQVDDGAVKDAFDVLGVHAFGLNNPPDDWTDVQTVPGTDFKGEPSFYFKRFTQLREVMLAHGDDKPMWMTEVGWSSCRVAVPGYEYCRDNSEADQARYLAEALRMLTSYPYVTNVFVWNLNFQMVVPESDEKWGYGIVRPDGRPRPAYVALQQVLAKEPAGS